MAAAAVFRCGARGLLTSRVLLMPVAFQRHSAHLRTPNTPPLFTPTPPHAAAAGSDAAATDADDEAAIGDRDELAATTLEEGRANFFYKPRVSCVLCVACACVRRARCVLRAEAAA
jgi:hypothetical protein